MYNVYDMLQGLLNMYSADKPDLIAVMLQRLSNTTFLLFSRAMSDHPDIVQAFFSLHLAALRAQPQVFNKINTINCISRTAQPLHRLLDIHFKTTP